MESRNSTLLSFNPFEYKEGSVYEVYYKKSVKDIVCQYMMLFEFHPQQLTFIYPGSDTLVISVGDLTEDYDTGEVKCKIIPVRLLNSDVQELEDLRLYSGGIYDV